MSKFLYAPSSAETMHKKETFDSLEYLPTAYLPHCRICLEETGELIQLPCACIGQIGLVHAKCFNKWVQTLRNDPYLSHSRIHTTQQSPTNPSPSNPSPTNPSPASPQNSYQIPCQICQSKISIHLQQKRSCISLKDLKKPEIIFSIFCILFNLGILGVVSYFCINGIIKAADSGLRIFINVFIMVIMYLILGWIVKKQAERLFVRNITDLKIVGTTPLSQDNQIVNFVVEQQPDKNTIKSSTTSNNNPKNNIDIELEQSTSERRRRRRRTRRENAL